MDEFAPAKMVTSRRQQLAVWIGTECIELRRRSRMLEHRCRRCNLPSDKLEWVQHERRRHQIYRSKEASYWNRQFIEQSKQSKKLCRSMATLLGYNTGKNLSPNQSPKIFSISSIKKLRQYGKLLKICLQSPICHHHQQSLTVSDHSGLMK